MERKLILAGAAFCAALFLFSGFMLCRQYIDDKKSAETFETISALVEEETPEAAPQESETETTTQTGFPLREQISTIPLCRPSTNRITI